MAASLFSLAAKSSKASKERRATTNDTYCRFLFSRENFYFNFIN